MDEDLIKEEIKKHFNKCYDNGDDPILTAVETSNKMHDILLLAAEEIRNENKK